MADDLVFESTTDSPEQIREGLGLPQADPAPAVATEIPVVAAGETPAAEAEAAPVSGAAPPATVGDPAGEGDEAPVQTRGADGKFVTPPKARKPVAVQPRIDKLTRENTEVLARATTAEAERDALKRRLDELVAPKPVAAAPPVVAAPVFDPDTYRDPAVTAAYERQRTALGAEPKQEDFEDFQEFRRSERSYDRKLAAIDANESTAHQRAADRASLAAQDATRAVQATFSTFAERQNAARARHADWDEVMQQGMAIPFKGRPYANDIQQAILESEQGPEIVYHLAQHPEELARLQAAPSVHVAMVELGGIAAALKAAPPASVPAGATQTGPATAVAPVVAAPPSRSMSRAPEPQGTALGGSASTTPQALDDPNISQAEYNRRRNAQDKSRRGR